MGSDHQRTCPLVHDSKTRGGERVLKIEGCTSAATKGSSDQVLDVRDIKRGKSSTKQRTTLLVEATKQNNNQLSCGWHLSFSSAPCSKSIAAER